MSDEHKNLLSRAYQWIKQEVNQGNRFIIVLLIIASFWSYSNIVQPSWDFVIKELKERKYITEGNAEVIGMNAVKLYEMEQKLKLLEDRFNKQVKEMRTGQIVEIEL